MTFYFDSNLNLPNSFQKEMDEMCALKAREWIKIITGALRKAHELFGDGTTDDKELAKHCRCLVEPRSKEYPHGRSVYQYDGTTIIYWDPFRMQFMGARYFHPKPEGKDSTPTPENAS